MNQDITLIVIDLVMMGQNYVSRIFAIHVYINIYICNVYVCERVH